MRVAYAGSLIAPELVHSFSGSSVAGNKFQHGLLSGFEAEGVHVDQFVVPPIAAFPRERRVVARMGHQDVGMPGARVVPFVNLIGVKQATIAVGLFLRLLGWALRTRREPNRVLVTYNAFSFIAGPVLLVKRLTGLPAVVVLADIQPPAATGAARVEAAFQHSAIARFDGIVEISRHIGDDFAPGTPALVIEGGVHDLPLDVDPPREVGERATVLLFSGALDENSGIGRLLGAFARLPDQSLVLRVLGKGRHSDDVIRAAATDPRIDYVGYVDNVQAVELQRTADVLVSPRLPDAHTTRYSFPSKLMEYLATGSPVVSSRLPGIPTDYHQHLLIPRDDSDRAFADALAAAVSTPRTADERQRQLDFVRSKHWPLRSAEAVRFLATVVTSP